MKKTQLEAIRLRGITQNNLKNLDIDIPLGKLVVVTGLSGTGKSSLVFDTLHAEGQRRYVETFSPYMRQFLEMLSRPELESAENVRPSIAIQQTNTIKTSRSTVGTMTELCDYFKVWFAQSSHLYDPATGKRIEDDNPQSIWKKALASHKDETLCITFKVDKPERLSWDTIFTSLQKQGYARCLLGKLFKRIDELDTKALQPASLHVVQDRVELKTSQKSRFIEAATTALHFGNGEMQIASTEGEILDSFTEGFTSPQTGKHFKKATPSLFSFNSPLGACPECRGFGRTIEIDDSLIIPDPTLSISEGVIRPFRGKVYSECQRELIEAAKEHKIPIHKPWNKLTKKHQDFVFEGAKDCIMPEDGPPIGWYGIRRFFKWLESKSYKMHVRVFLSKYRSYTTCPRCKGARIQEEALNFKWKGYTLPELYQLPVSELHALIEKHSKKETGAHENLAEQAILTRLRFLIDVGLSYLTLDRTSRTLSGGEVQRVNLTACLGSSLVDTLYVLDEPSIGLHSSDIDRLISILKKLTQEGNTVVVVEHDESVMRAADHILELGPKPGNEGGYLTFSGSFPKIIEDKKSLTGAYLSGKKTIDTPNQRRSCGKTTPQLRIKGASLHNIQSLSLNIPLQRFIGISGVSGSGKSTLLDNIIYQGWMASQEKATEEAAAIESIQSDSTIDEIVLVDQSPLSKTPRSNPALYSGAWTHIREFFGNTDASIASGKTASHFSFNSGEGRCEHCQGLGYEHVEMQFLSDLYIPCSICEGKRFKQEILDITWNGKSVSDVLSMDIKEALNFFKNSPKIVNALKTIDAIGLGYLTLGQPLNTLSGGESQRLKLVKYLGSVENDAQHALLLLDEPSTGLHRDDIKRLIQVLQNLVDQGHSIIVIEHQIDILKSTDWLIELGPGAGAEGGKITAQGTPELLAQKATATAPFLAEALRSGNIEAFPTHRSTTLKAAQPKKQFKDESALTLVGAREHNLNNVSLSIPLHTFNVVTGVSGSGKSSLAFDIIFAEGQRRFLESMSSYARQFVEQLPRADVDALSHVPPAVAIEQRVTRGSRKSTVATITEVAQYLRLLFAKIGEQYSPKTGKPVTTTTVSELHKRIETRISSLPKSKRIPLYLCTPLVRSRKGHHQPLARWAERQGYEALRIDGKIVSLSSFKPLDRYKEHDIELIVTDLNPRNNPNQTKRERLEKLERALKLGGGTCFILDKEPEWLSTERFDTSTGEAFPKLDPKHFSWNSEKGWCPTCRGYGKLYSWMKDDESFNVDETHDEEGTLCHECDGGRLNVLSRNVRLHTQSGKNYNLPELLNLPPKALVECLKKLKLNTRERTIAETIIPEIAERLDFMNYVGLDYLSLDRETITLSGGEAQRIRLASQLGSTLSGALYVLDEPSIGLHARDNDRLIDSLLRLRDRGNTLLVVEHDEDTMRAADSVIDLGPGAGIHGGNILAQGPIDVLRKNKNSLTGQYLSKPLQHPLRGNWRSLPKAWNIKQKESPWIVLRSGTLRNLKNVTLSLPTERLSVVCGISGAGKSTLIRDLLKPLTEEAIAKKKAVLVSKDAKTLRSTFKDLRGASVFKNVIEVDQEPIGKTIRSTPATYIGIFDLIRELLATLPESKMHGYNASTFSFNTAKGRCETCKGAGRIKLEMNFLPNAHVSCDACQGKRYGSEVLEVCWNGKNIADILDLSFEEAVLFFDFHERLKAICTLMTETGLGYLKLGQASPTLSGGEAQRLKLVSELAKGLPSFKDKSRGVINKNLYLLEEPTIGLHTSDCKRLIELLHRLVDQGHTVVVIEHHLDLIAEADYVIEMGPEGGENGGHLLYQGNIQGLAKLKKSPTAPYLRKCLG